MCKIPKHSLLLFIIVLFTAILSPVEAAKCINNFQLVECDTVVGNNVPQPLKDVFYCGSLKNCDPNQLNINTAVLAAKNSNLIHNRAECMGFAEDVIEETKQSYGSAIPFFSTFASRARDQATDACNNQFRATAPQLVPPGYGKYGPGKTIKGYKTRDLSQTSPDKCYSICSNDSNCKGYTIHRESGVWQCKTFSSIDSLADSNNPEKRAYVK